MRVPDARFACLVGEAFERLPLLIRQRLGHVQFFCGVDPVFAGLHRFDDCSYGRSYRSTAHTCYPSHIERPADQRVTTVVLPRITTPEVVVHELGHALDEVTGFSVSASPVSWYAATCRSEAYAEAFCAWVTPGYADQDTLRGDRVVIEHFESLT